MTKIQFISNLSKQTLLFPSRIDEDIADDAPVRIIDQVLENIDISRIVQLYHVHGRNAFHPRTMLKVIIPQVMRNILPSVSNEFVINIKDTSVLNVIGVTEL